LKRLDKNSIKIAFAVSAILLENKMFLIIGVVVCLIVVLLVVLFYKKNEREDLSSNWQSLWSKRMK